MSVESLDQLPDDVLVHVMQYLDPADLIMCRLVCKRIGGLALHREAWCRRRRLGRLSPRVVSCACPVLRLAPCLDTLTILTNTLFHLRVLKKTKCAVKTLHLALGEKSDQRLAAVVIRNQTKLGRMRNLHLEGLLDGGSTLLSAVLAAASSLERLDVKCSVSWELKSRTSLDLPVERGPSLKRFKFLGDFFLADFVSSVLTGHAATLEEVVVDVRDYFKEEDMSATSRLLAGIPKLRSLTCPALPGLEAVTARGTLQELCLNVHDEDHLAAVELLGRAEGLRKVTLRLPKKQQDTYLSVCQTAPKVLDALVSSASRIESLAVLDLWRLQQMHAIARVLPSMPWLRQLTVPVGPDNRVLLEAITPHTAPALRTLELRRVGNVGMCHHAWLHSWMVEKVLRVNPELHIHLSPSPQKCTGSAICMYCVLGRYYKRQCHQEVMWGKVELLGLFSHDPDQCSAPEYHPRSVFSQWIHLPRNSA